MQGYESRLDVILLRLTLGRWHYRKLNVLKMFTGSPVDLFIGLYDDGFL